MLSTAHPYTSTHTIPILISILLHIHDQSHSRQHPLGRRGLGLELRAEDEGWSAELRLVGGADVDALRDIHLIGCKGLDVDDGHLAEHLLRFRALQDACRGVPPGTLQGHTDDVGAVPRDSL